MEDRIRQAKATGLANLPFNSFDANAAWLEIIMAATDLIAWTKLIGFTDHPDLARCEIETFRYRVLHVAARITRSARQLRLRIDSTWRWARADRHRLDAGSAPPSPNTRTPVTRRDERPTGPRKARPTGATPGDLPYPPATINPTSQPAPPPPDPARPHEKSRLGVRQSFALPA